MMQIQAMSIKTLNNVLFSIQIQQIQIYRHEECLERPECDLLIKVNNSKVEILPTDTHNIFTTKVESLHVKNFYMH